MKKTLLLSGITALFVCGTMLTAAEPGPQGPKDNPPCSMRQSKGPGCGPMAFWNPGFPPGRCPMMQQKGCPMMQKRMPFAGPMSQKKGFGHCNGFGFGPRFMMNEDEMAKFMDLRLSIKDALDEYRTAPTEKNQEALRAAVAKMVDARQQFEIERCEKALARAKAAKAQKDTIVARTMKRLTKPAPKAPCPGPKAPAPKK